MKINKSSIWDKFYCFPDEFRYTTTNICEYTRGVLRGILASIFLVLVGAFMGTFLSYPYFVGSMTILTGQFIPDMGVFLISLIIHGILLGAATRVWLENRPRKTKVSKPPSFISIWWQSVKERTCFIVERTE